MDYQDAKKLMEKGAVMGCNGSIEFDYYRIEDGNLIAFYSCDNEDYIVLNPLELKDGWYFIYWG